LSSDAHVGADAHAACSLRIQLLGGFRVWVGDEPIPEKAWSLRKAAAIVKLLALSPTRSLHREVLLDTLWPDLEPDAAGNNLRYALYIARRAFPSPSPFLALTGETIALTPPLIVSEAQIGEIFDKVAQVIRAVA